MIGVSCDNVFLSLFCQPSAVSMGVRLIHCRLWGADIWRLTRLAQVERAIATVTENGTIGGDPVNASDTVVQGKLLPPPL